MTEKIVKTDQEWRAELSPEEYHVLREHGTERAFTGKYWATKEEGVYRCAGCGAELFTSQTKYESGTGWPSFYDPAREEAVETERDWSLLVPRTEVHCADTSSVTAPHPRGSATASTRRPSHSTPRPSRNPAISRAGRVARRHRLPRRASPR
jgi:peptide-methionine (R)-S-oxide reductase